MLIFCKYHVDGDKIYVDVARSAKTNKKLVRCKS